MRIFISYAHDDKIPAILFEKWLREAGWNPLRDESDFGAGYLPDLIGRGIAGCDLMLAVLSKRFYESDWTRGELGQAEALGKPILFVAIDETRPRGAYEHWRPFELHRTDADVWNRELVAAVNTTMGGGASRHDGLDHWLSDRLGSNRPVADAVARENLANRLHVGSAVELAQSLAGWRPGDIHAHDSGLFEPEDEVRRMPGADSPTGSEAIENFALRSLREDLTDEPFLQLELQRVPSHLVRFVADNFETIRSEESPARHLFGTGKLPFPHSVVGHLTLVTSDGYLLLGHRSARPRFYENRWSATYEEHLTPPDDGVDIFRTALRGLREELVGKDATSIDHRTIRLFSVFRELDHSSNEERNESFWVINVGIAGLIRLPIPVDIVFRNWLKAVDNREFRHLAAVPYTFKNVLSIAEADTFDPRYFGKDLRVPGGTDPFPDFEGKPSWRRQHPTNKIRLARCLTADYLHKVEELAGAL